MAIDNCTAYSQPDLPKNDILHMSYVNIGGWPCNNWNMRIHGLRRSSNTRFLYKVNICHYTQVHSPRIEREATLRYPSIFENSSPTSSFSLSWRKHGVNARHGRLYKGPTFPSLGSFFFFPTSKHLTSSSPHGGLSTLLHNRVRNIFSDFLIYIYITQTEFKAYSHLYIYTYI